MDKRTIMTVNGTPIISAQNTKNVIEDMQSVLLLLNIFGGEKISKKDSKLVKKELRLWVKYWRLYTAIFEQISKNNVRKQHLMYDADPLFEALIKTLTDVYMLTKPDDIKKDRLKNCITLTEQLRSMVGWNIQEIEEPEEVEIEEDEPAVQETETREEDA